MANGRDYRIFVGAFLSGDLAAQVQAVRQRYDPLTARITPPHVTLAGTYWRAGTPTPIQETTTITRLKALEGRLAGFDLVLGGIRAFPGPRPVVYLSVQVTPELLAVRRALLSVLGADQHREYTPHLTLAMRLERPDAAAMTAELEQGEWHQRRWRTPIRELRLMQRGPADPAWRSIAVVKLSA